VEDAKIGKNPLFLATFGGFLGFSKEEKGSPDGKYGKFYLLLSFCILINQKENFV
jgi:hypothetical protein